MVFSSDISLDCQPEFRRCAKRPTGLPGNVVAGGVVYSPLMLAGLGSPGFPENVQVEMLVHAKRRKTVRRGTLMGLLANSVEVEHLETEPIRTGSNGASESTGWSAVIWQTLQRYIST